MTNTNSPEGWLLNGDVASKRDIESMEKLAWGVLLREPAEYCREYGYIDESGDATVFFSTVVYEDIPQAGSFASVRVGSDSIPNLKFRMTFDGDNQLSSSPFGPEGVDSEITSLLQELLEDGRFRPAELAILRHMQAIVFCAMNAITPENIGVLADADANKDFQHVADVIRSQVEKNTEYTLRTKGFVMPFENGDILNVLSQEVIGHTFDQDDIELIPVLQIEYQDTANRTIYAYSREDSSTQTLNTTVYKDGESEISVIAEEDESIDDEVAAFAEALGMNVPGKHQVELIRRILSQAVELSDHEELNSQQ